MLRVARTDGNGHFTIKGVADGEYRIYALQDMDDNYCFSQKSERIAFTHETFRPSVSDRVRQDTVWKDALHIDSIVQIPYKHFLPDDIMLLSFQEEQTGRYLLKTERKEANCINVFFSYGNPQLPVIKGLNFDADNAFLDFRAPTAQGFGYCVFGRLTKGLDVLDAIAKVPTTTVSWYENVPAEPVVILSVRRA